MSALLYRAMFFLIIAYGPTSNHPIRLVIYLLIDVLIKIDLGVLQLCGDR